MALALLEPTPRVPKATSIGRRGEGEFSGTTFAQPPTVAPIPYNVQGLPSVARHFASRAR